MERLFHNTIDLKKNIAIAGRKALQDTLEQMTDKLHEIIIEDVYRNKPTFYQRSKWLLSKPFKAYVYNNFGKGVGGGIKPDGSSYGSNLKKFQHGNEYFGALPMESFLEMLNYSGQHWLAENPFNFPTWVDRAPFWEDFLEWAEGSDGFNKLYQENLDKYTWMTPSGRRAKSNI